MLIGRSTVSNRSLSPSLALIQPPHATIGGFSKVRLGTHLLTGEKVAIKCMEKEKLGEDLFRVQTEINALKVLQHENISKLLQVIETETKIYLILEVNIGFHFDFSSPLIKLEFDSKVLHSKSSN